ncbi:MAG TPA: hypothetical protein VFZ63_04720 [Jiangellaceae bacterium]
MRMKHRGEDRLAAFLDQLGRADDLTRLRVVRPELADVFEYGLPGHTTGVATAELPVHSRRRSMLTALSSALATLTGKVVLGTAVAAASVGAAHSAGVIDVPGLPDTSPAVESPAVDAPGLDGTTAGDPNPGGTAPDRPAGADGNGAPDGSGVDGDDVSDRATSGEPQDDGRAFGTSVAEDATDGTAADDRAGVSGGEPGDPVGGPETADERKPDTAPEGDDTATEHIPADVPADVPTERP